MLTASTSEAYSILFKLLCDPGHSVVMTPAPSYPLFDHLTRLDGVEPCRYALEYHGVWGIDLDDLDRVWTSDVRALLAVSPNNPTGSLLGERDADELAGRCAEADAALILDEVFCDYPLDPDVRRAEPRALVSPGCLVCRLGGLSKTAALPQVKLGWIALDGPADVVSEALDRLELICDTYLSVSTPVQLAAGALLDGTAGVRRQFSSGYARSTDPQGGRRRRRRAPADGGWSGGARAGHALGRPRAGAVRQDAVLVHRVLFDFPRRPSGRQPAA